MTNDFWRSHKRKNEDYSFPFFTLCSVILYWFSELPPLFVCDLRMNSEISIISEHGVLCLFIWVTEMWRILMARCFWRVTKVNCPCLLFREWKCGGDALGRTEVIWTGAPGHLCLSCPLLLWLTGKGNVCSESCRWFSRCCSFPSLQGARIQPESLHQYYRTCCYKIGVAD